MSDRVKAGLSNFIQNPRRILMLCLSVSGLALVFIFQEFDILSAVFRTQQHPFIHFVVNKAWRVLLNDSLMLVLIYAWFFQKSVTQVAWKLQLIDTCILLPLYLFLKLMIEGPAEISSPLLSQLHRLIVNPTIMILLIPGVYLQRITEKRTL